MATEMALMMAATGVLESTAWVVLGFATTLAAMQVAWKAGRRSSDSGRLASRTVTAAKKKERMHVRQ